MSDETFVCESCGHRRMDSDLCEHDYNIHTWCIECCADSNYEPDPVPAYLYKDDMD